MELKRFRSPALFILALPFLVLLPTMGDFPYRSAETQFTDYAITHYPNALFLLRSIQEYGQIPLWSPAILSGYPFFANPLSGLFYPPGWLALLFPLPFGFNLALALHLIWGGLGMFWLMKVEGLSSWAALFSGLGFAMLPKVFAHYGAGHLTLLFALAWTPWLLLCQVKKGGFDYRHAKIVIPAGIILGIIFLADVRWAVYAGLLWVAYVIAHRHGESIWHSMVLLVGQVGLAFLIAAPLALPLIEYTLRSSRDSMGIDQVGAYSLPAVKLVGLLFPDFHGNHEWVVYAGGIGLVFGILALTSHNVLPARRFWGLVLMISLIFALGDALPGFAWLAKVPLFDLLRAPSRAIFLSGISLAGLAGYGVDSIYSHPESEPSRRANLALVALFAFTLILGIGLSFLTDAMVLNVIWGMAFSLVGVFWIFVGIKKRISQQAWLVGVFCLAILDWGGVARFSFSPRSTQVVISEQSAVAEYLATQTGQFRVFSPSYSLPQQTAGLHDLQLADGVDPLQLETYADYMEQASGVPRGGYQVSIPTFATGDPTQDNAKFIPDMRALGKLNVAYVLSAFDIQTDALDLVEMVGETRLYRNLQVKPRAWVQPSGNQIGEGITSVVAVISWSPNRIELSAQGPGLLVLSEIAYPGWYARIDGDIRPILTLENMFRGVELGPGSHRVVFALAPWSLYAGLFLLIMGCVSWLVLQIRVEHSRGAGNDGLES